MNEKKFSANCKLEKVNAPTGDIDTPWNHRIMQIHAWPCKKMVHKPTAQCTNHEISESADHMLHQ